MENELDIGLVQHSTVTQIEMTDTNKQFVQSEAYTQVVVVHRV